ncbi:MAG TPA: ATP-binding protein [Nitrososphaerales archaeon]|nr:ATP-binding protein [Nitrososphaerales archaeon]
MTGFKLPSTIDRKEQIERLVSSLPNTKKNVNYALIGPRQIGKTTILHEVARRLSDEGIIAVHLDFGVYRFAPSEFSETLIRGLLQEYARKLGRIEKAFKKANELFEKLKGLKRVRPIFEVGSDKQSPSILVHLERVEENPREALELAFKYANALAEESKMKVVIILDEFQHYVEFDSLPKLHGALDIFRAAIDARGNVSYVVSGSRVHFLKQVLGDGKSPLFGRFTILEVGTLKEKYAKELFEEASFSTPKSGEGEEAEEAFKLVGGHPFYLLALAEGRMIQKGEGESIDQTYDRLLKSPIGSLHLYVKYVLSEDLGSGIRGSRFIKILRSLAPKALKVSKISNATGIKLTNLPWYIGKLIEYDLVEKIGGEYSIKDSLIQDYFLKVGI